MRTVEDHQIKDLASVCSSRIERFLASIRCRRAKIDESETKNLATLALAAGLMRIFALSCEMSEIPLACEHMRCKRSY